MMAAQERTIERAVCSWAEGKGVLVLKFTPANQRGWPDRMFIYGGRMVCIEFKAPGRKPTRLQVARIELLRQRGIATEVVDEMMKGVRFIDRQLFMPLRQSCLFHIPSV